MYSTELVTGELKELDEVNKLDPEYPGWMIERQGSSRYGNYRS